MGIATKAVIWAKSLDELVEQEAQASYLHGRYNGPADAYRHLLIAAELTRQFGKTTASDITLNYERYGGLGLYTDTSRDKGMDLWNNMIGSKIGEYVRSTNGSWKDVVRLSRLTIAQSFSSESYDEVAGWREFKGDEVLQRVYSHYKNTHSDPDSFEDFSHLLGSDKPIKTSDNLIFLDGEEQVFVYPIALYETWTDNPKGEAHFPDEEWLSGKEFQYDKVGEHEDETVDDEDRVIFKNSDRVKNQQHLRECFAAGTPITMWPTDSDLKPDADGHFDQTIVQEKAWTKPVEEIRTGNLVMSFDKKGRLVPGTVGRTFQKTVPHLLNWFGTKVTPGHVYLCGEPGDDGEQRFEQLLNILLADGCVVLSNGRIVRASIKRPAGGSLDRLVQVRAVALRPGDKAAKVDLTVLPTTETGLLRNGTLIPMPSRKGKTEWKTLDALLKKEKWKLHEDGTVSKRGHPYHGPLPLLASKLPTPLTYILEQSKLTLSELMVVREYEMRQEALTC